MNILIVEDNDIQLQSLYKILSEKYTEDSFTYMLADNYDEAICIINTNNIDIFILDIALGDNPNGGTGTGTDVTPSVTPKPATAVPAKQQTTPQEIKEDPAASQASDDNDHEQIDQPESGGQSQGGGEQGEIQPESKIYKLIKSVANTIQENPIASAAIGIAVIGIILFGAWNRRRKEDAEKK